MPTMSFKNLDLTNDCLSQSLATLTRPVIAVPTRIQHIGKRYQGDNARATYPTANTHTTRHAALIALIYEGCRSY